MEFGHSKSFSEVPLKAAPLQVEKLEEAEADAAFEEALDWLGRPATDKHGGPRTSFFILWEKLHPTPSGYLSSLMQIASQGLWNVANFAVATNLVIYFLRVLQMGNATAANNVTNWFGTMWLLTLFGGFLGDAYWGRFWTCSLFQIVHIVGLVLLGLSATTRGLKPPSCGPAGTFCPKPTSLQISVFFVAIYIIALGSGGYLPAFVAWGADQFDSEKQKTTFFGWLLVFQNVGSVLANTVFVWVENKGEWALGFWLATGVGVLACVVFATGVPTYRQYRPGGNSFVRVAQVISASVRKWRVRVPDDTSLLHELPAKELTRQGSRKMQHTPRFSFFDKAATRLPGDDAEPWRLCHVTQVEELKCLCRMLPIWLCAIPFAAVLAQINTLFVEQATIMDTKIGNFSIPPASMSVINVASIFVFTVLYPVTVVPLARLVTGRPEGLSQLQRLGWGQTCVAVAMGVSAIVEAKRLKLVAMGQQISVFWLTPQQVILGLAQVLAVVGAMDFFYTEAPHAMRGLVSSLSLANLAIGSYASTVLVSLTMHYTTKGGRPGWIPSHNLNVGHVDYFYWLLMGLTILDIMLYVVSCRWYRRTAAAARPPHHNDPPSLIHPSL